MKPEGRSYFVMQFKKISNICLILLVLLACNSAFAENDKVKGGFIPPQMEILDGTSNLPQIDRLTLDQAVQRTLLHNRTIENVRKAIQEAMHYQSAVQKERLPKLSTTYSYMRLGDELDMTAVDPSTGVPYKFPVMTADNYSWTTTLSMPLYSGGAQRLSEDVARLGIDLAKVKLIASKNEMVMLVKCYYYDLLRSEHLVDFLQQSLERCKKHEALTVKYHREGLVAKNDVLQARVETANARQELYDSQCAREIAASTLCLAMGDEIDRKYILEDVPLKGHFKMTLEQCREFAEKNNPELVAFIFLKEQARKAIDLEMSHYNPTLSLSASYMKYGDSPSMRPNDIFPTDILFAMLNLNWNVFDWGQKSEVAKVKKTQLEEIINNEKIARDNLMLRIKGSYSRMKTAEVNVEIAALALEQAREGVRIANLRYRDQVAEATEVIDAMTQLRRAEMNQFNSIYSFNVAIARLESAMGIEVEKIIDVGK